MCSNLENNWASDLRNFKPINGDIKLPTGYNCNLHIQRKTEKISFAK